MRRIVLLGSASALLIGLIGVPASVAAPPDPDDRVSVASAYVRHDGGTDRAIQECSDTSTSTAPDTPGDGDTDSN
ncbi:MAG TPA: hypothetical protein VKE25_06815, partial [Actinomycetes bacterium]|nr:hypothetical protein [Actinomycetes bacterium]